MQSSVSMLSNTNKMINVVTFLFRNSKTSSISITMATTWVPAWLLASLIMTGIFGSAHGDGMTDIEQDLLTKCDFVLYDNNDSFPTQTVFPGGKAQWVYSTTRSDYYRVAMRAVKETPRKAKTIEVWSRQGWPGVMDPRSMWKVNETGLYSMNMQTWAWVFLQDFGIRSNHQFIYSKSRVAHCGCPASIEP